MKSFSRTTVLAPSLLAIAILFSGLLAGCGGTTNAQSKPNTVSPVAAVQSKPAAAKPAAPQPATFAEQVTANAQRRNLSVQPTPADVDKLMQKVADQFGGDGTNDTAGYYHWRRHFPEDFVIAAANIQALVTPQQYRQILAAKNPISGQTLEGMWNAAQQANPNDSSALICGNTTTGSFTKGMSNYNTVTSHGKYPYYYLTLCKVVPQSGGEANAAFTTGVSHPFNADPSTGVVTFAPYVYLYDAPAGSFTYKKQVGWLN
jgi:hypothetical protein